MSQDVALGLQVTALGMALVFLTLIIVMLAIMLLSRVFRTAGSEAAEPTPALPTTSPLEGATTAPTEDAADEAAAIAVALALAARRTEVAQTKPEPDPFDGRELLGEPVTVISLAERGAGWRSHERVKSSF